jgi:hypothetical protein
MKVTHDNRRHETALFRDLLLGQRPCLRLSRKAAELPNPGAFFGLVFRSARPRSTAARIELRSMSKDSLPRNRPSNL